MVTRRQFIRRGALFIPAVAGLVGCPSVTGQASMATRRMRHRLLAGLSAYWHLDEASGTRAEAFGNAALTLTDKNTCGSAAGIAGLAASLTYADADGLYCADNSAVRLTTSDFTIGVWLWIPATKTQGEVVMAKRSPAWIDDFEYTLFFNSADLSMYVLDVGLVTSQDISVGTPAATTWHYAVCGRSGSTLFTCLNAGVRNTEALAVTPFESTARFQFGCGSSGTGVGAFTGLLDEVALWKRALSMSEIAFLYNGGAGRRIV